MTKRTAAKARAAARAASTRLGRRKARTRTVNAVKRW